MLGLIVEALVVILIMLLLVMLFIEKFAEELEPLGLLYLTVTILVKLME